MSSADLRLRDISASDLATLHAINQEHRPHLGDVTSEAFAELVRMAFIATVVVADEKPTGFLIALRPDAPYSSLNFTWFRERYTQFVYVDRLVVVPNSQRSGVGRLLYDHVEEQARSIGAGCITCEVNEEPPNPTSLRFHEALGFEVVGRQETEGGAKRVALLRRGVAP